MENLDKALKSMTFEFFGGGNHKMTAEKFMNAENTFFLDVRAMEEFETLSFGLKYHMPSAHIPINQVCDRINELPKDKTIGIFCASGNRSTMVYLYLKAHGFDNVRIIEGGYNELVAELKPGKLLQKLKEPVLS
ncbi:MAG: rhodanese-like domain-containing protein [Spirochaetales bacterium]|uniref:Rhodanese-like domain-containing protein n=1 Tax=Candidatus Thalassospirochaeta sargassi TaxID=3119039 RepID=A0AAJ1IGK4_9SPIO|nr:rhodanese-like domain-containing protein [Spirochaetales bacterium]